MTPRDAEEIVLFLGIEDFSTLWEITNERAFIAMPRERSIEFARAALVELLRRGLVKLYRCEEPHRRLNEIEDGEWGAVLSDARSWREPAPDSISIRFGTTADGKATLMGGDA
jgi:hypothetical protein